MNYKDTWEVDDQGKKFVFTVEMKRRLAQEGLPLEPGSLAQLKVAKSTPAPQTKKTKTAPVAIKEPDVIQIDPESGKYIGVLKWYNPSRGYGFISRGGGEDIFFHKTSTIGDPTELDEGQSVLYDVEDRPKGPEATEVEPFEGRTGSMEEPTELDEGQAVLDDVEDEPQGSEPAEVEPYDDKSSTIEGSTELDEGQAILSDVEDTPQPPEAMEEESYDEDNPG